MGGPVVAPIGDEVRERRIAAIACYASQVPVIFRSTSDFAGAVAAFAREVGGELGPAERFWPVLPWR